MSQKSISEILTGLTSDQQKAILKLLENQKGRMFIGIFPETTASDFRTVNSLRITDEAKANSNEQALFALCGYDPSNT